MQEWEQREMELQRQENAWFDKLNPFMKMIDNPLYYMLSLLMVAVFCFGIGVLIGVML